MTKSTPSNEKPAPTRAGLTATDIARHFRIAPASVRRWVRQGRVPAYRVGSHLRFDLDAVKAALEVNAGSYGG